MFSIDFQQTSPQGVNDNSANQGNSGLSSNTASHTEGHVKEIGDGDLCQELKSQLFDDRLRRLWRTGALLKLYNSDEDCEVC